MSTLKHEEPGAKFGTALALSDGLLLVSDLRTPTDGHVYAFALRFFEHLGLWFSCGIACFGWFEFEVREVHASERYQLGDDDIEESLDAPIAFSLTQGEGPLGM